MRNKLNKEAVLNLANQGKRPNEIAEILNCKHQSVRTILYKEGFEFPTKGISTGGIVIDRKDEILQLYNEGLKPIQIAKQLSLNSISVNSFLLSLGLKSNPEIKNPSYFDIIDTSNKAYFLGFIAADGALVKDTQTEVKSLTITIKETDRIILEKFKEELQSNHTLLEIRRPSSFDSSKMIHHIRFTFRREEITKALESYGIGSNKSLTMEDIIDNIPLPFRDAFIIGYLVYNTTKNNL